MKRLVAALTTSGLLAAGLSVGALAQPAAADDAGLEVTIASAGTKKVNVTWADPSTILTSPFDAYLVTLDNDSGTTPDTADRSRYVDDAVDNRSVGFEDLNAGTTYYATVYAVDFQEDGVHIVPADAEAADTALGVATGTYSPLRINSSASTVLSGKTVTLSGTLKDDAGDAIVGADITISQDGYPQFGGLQSMSDQTDANGRWEATSTALTANAWFWAEYLDEDGVGGWTGRTLVEVRKKLSIAVQPGTTVNAGTKVTFTGDTKGDPDFLDDANVKVCLQHLEGGKWVKKFCRADEADGSYVLSFKPGPGADGKYRAWSGMGPAYADSWSRTKKMTVN